MSSSFCAFILKVHDLERCRAFYRDLLQLGQPVTDSNFRTEFDLGNDKRLVICRAREESRQTGKSNAALWLEPDNPDAMMEMLASGGFMPGEDDLDMILPDVKCYHDPEGNPVYLLIKRKS